MSHFDQDLVPWAEDLTLCLLVIVFIMLDLRMLRHLVACDKQSCRVWTYTLYSHGLILKARPKTRSTVSLGCLPYMRYDNMTSANVQAFWSFVG